jgi:predicted acylesterase/phospholipase RssA
MRRITLVGLALVFLPPTLTAQDRPGRDTTPIIFTVSGGISRGAYQGGLNWGLVEIARRSTYDTAFQRKLLRLSGKDAVPKLYLSAVAGASAGNINGLLSAIEWCRNRRATVPEQSVFWRSWVWTGWEQLSWGAKDSVRADEQGLFDRRFFKEVLLQSIRKDVETSPFREGCHVPVGVTATRLLPDSIAIAPGIDASSQRFAIPFVVKVEGGRLHVDRADPPALVDRTLGEVLELTDSQDGSSQSQGIGLDGIFPAIEASSAYPLAFGPRTLNYHKAADMFRRSAQFVDGGVFDNNPLGLAYGLYRCSPTTVKETPYLEKTIDLTAQKVRFCNAPTGPATLVYMDPDARRDSSGSLIASDLETEPVKGLSSLTKLFGGAVKTGRQYELAVFNRTRQLLPGGDNLHLAATNRFQGIVGDQFNAFGAFLGRPFREYDFYAGIYDAVRFAAVEWLCVSEHEKHALSAGGNHACVEHLMNAAACRGVLETLTPSAAVVLAALFEQEFDTPVRCQEVALEGADPGDSVQAARDTVLVAIARANDTVRRLLSKPGANGDPFRCKVLEFLEELICANGFGVILNAMSAPSVRASLQTLSRTQSSACNDGSWKSTPDSLEHCHADPLLVGLVEDRIGTADVLFRDVFRRLLMVENGLALERGVDVAELFYYLGRKPNLQGFVFLTSTIPSTHRAAERLGRLPPYHVSTLLGNNSIVLGYRPTLYTRRRLQLVFPVEFSSVVRHVSPRDSLYAVNTVNAFSVGFGPGWLFGSNLLESVQLVGLWSARDCGAPNTSQIGGELSASFLLGRFRLGHRLVASADRGVFGREKHSWVVGLNDVSGTLYWAFRIIR